MTRGFTRVAAALIVAAGSALVACGGDDGDDEPAAQGGSAGKAGNGGSSGAGSGAGPKGGTAGSLSEGGNDGNDTGGDPSSGGSSDVAVGGAGGDTAVDGGGAAGAGGQGSEPCTPPSTDGFPYAGSCLYDDYCSDQYDTMLGAETLQLICEDQSGTWSTTSCSPEGYIEKCTAEVFGGVYVNYRATDTFCALGCEEPL